MKLLLYLIIAATLFSAELKAHPMPNSVLLLDIKENGVAAELQWPLNEFQLAFPNQDIDAHPATLPERKSAWLEAYLREHIHIAGADGRAWTITIKDKKVSNAEQTATGPFRELVFELWFQPPPGVSPRHFTMNYDAIIHQVVTHKMLIRIREDWDGGLSQKDSVDAELGLLMMGTGNNIVPPLIVNLDEGSKWKGFKSMVALGISHILEGTDHLLFLLVLMLPSPLLASGGQWTKSGGTKYSIIRLLKIATAFTIGHSLTLLAGAVGWLRLSAQPVEILISISIFVGAIHALRPLFPGKEIFVAAGFGLIHGLAFATVLSALNLDGSRMALSILGFNIGIELMQLFVILLFVPWMIMLSHYSGYKWIRIIGALFALMASTAWIVERITQKPNNITIMVQHIATQAHWLVLALALVTIITFLLPGARIALRENATRQSE